MKGSKVNRQTKRLMKKDEERKKAGGRPAVKAPGAPTKKERTKPGQFFKEVLAELRKVAWPTRQEVIAYSMVVLVSTIVVGAIIFGMDYIFTQAVLALFGVN
ncbi:MAG: preprotein translocase subunit SecE [Actinomycetota bacterium]|jgi:preprotein translocase subunit SecE|nr:preprotein translocase subunit SecE [Actinomycetota bacterium]